MSRTLVTALGLVALAAPGAHAVAATTPAPAATPLIVLPNLDDDSRRCPHATADARRVLRDARGRVLTQAAVTGCSDAADEHSNGPADMLDITPVRLGAQPRVAARPGARVSARVAGGPAGAFRVMARRGGAYVSLAERPLTAADLRRPVTLGVEGTTIRRGGWDGHATLRVSAPGMRRVDVPILLAPVIYQDDLQPVRMLITAGTDPASPAGQRDEWGAARTTRATRPPP